MRADYLSGIVSGEHFAQLEVLSDGWKVEITSNIISQVVAPPLQL
jgi:hypothetical protein